MGGPHGGDPDGRRIFFTNSPAILGYTNYVQYFLNRTNHYTGVQYKNDPTIFAWEVMNEPRYQNESATENTAGTKLRAWMDNVGAFIKSVDTDLIENMVSEASPMGWRHALLSGHWRQRLLVPFWCGPCD